MSVYLVNPSTEEEEEDNPTEEGSNAITISVEDNPTCNVAALHQFWPKVTEDIRKIGTLDLKTQSLPLARIKKVMKLDENVKMISAEAPMLFSKAAEIFINELTLRAWIHTEDNRRRTLQRNDIAMAITKYDQFDFLIDIVPREEAKIVTKSINDNKTNLNPEQVQYYFQLAQQQQQQASSQSTTNAAQTIQILQPVTNQLVTLSGGSQDQVNIENIGNSTSNITTNTSTTVSGSQPQVIQLQGNPQTLNSNGTGVLQLVQQVITPSGEIQHIPIQLNSNQMQMLRMQVQNSPQTQQVQVVQTAQPQIIQVASQANGPTPVYISQSTVNPTSSSE
ncbi:nuclear transcription factor Y subunit gamma [Daktulosphaira vitifoliae]|uniref:nuclear transcription factor Y subunit gamma n=1 Tax=Daktulosphaira vitifoliae TaxID=58002 RepID=UPI0021AAE482|nr:nuclear transcription factor Y subunit gamma [Daktulosphaira vitifoliae]